MARRRKHSEEHENGERWLLTYADMITLLMALFIMLYSMSQLDIKKFDAMTGAVQAQLGGTGILKGAMNPSPGPEQRSGTPGIMPQLGGSPAALKKKLARELEPLMASAGLTIANTADGVTISIPATIVHFAAGSADPTPAMLAVLRTLAKTLARHRGKLTITGHTCNLPVHNERYQSNWELSADRARNVAFRLIDYGGVRAGNCSFMGLADTSPVAANDTEEHRQRNRRVEIRIEALPVTQPVPKPSEKADEPGETGAEPGAAPSGPVDIRPHLERAARR
ncbi:MAG: flagellar motor protein MotB [Armatimonadota bacterium]